MKKHAYSTEITWTGNTGQGTRTYTAYERSHTVLTGNKAAIDCSADPQFRGDKTKHNPEELFLAALAGCHLLMYLHLCAEAGVNVIAYSDQAHGEMEETDDGGGHFVEVILHPRVIVSNEHMIKQANELHKEAGRRCFIANSCNFPIRHLPVADIVNN